MSKVRRNKRKLVGRFIERLPRHAKLTRVANGLVAAARLSCLLAGKGASCGGTGVWLCLLCVRTNGVGRGALRRHSFNGTFCGAAGLDAGAREGGAAERPVCGALITGGLARGRPPTKV